MKIVQIILIAITAVSGCAKTAQMQVANDNTTTNTVNTPQAFTYLALGDSYTIGEQVPQSQSFPYQLVSLLAKDSINVATPFVIATTGWTTDNLINAISKTYIPNNHYDVVTLLIGVNDQYQGLSQDNYRVKFAQVLSTAIFLTGGDASRVFVISIPDWGVTPYANGQEAVIGPQIDQFNAINLDISQKAGVHYLNITPISKQAATDLSLVADDGLHPSGKMYGLWMAQLEPMVKARLGK